MPYGLYISAEGAHAYSKKLEVIANNMANVDTVGFKRDLARFEARYAEGIEQGEALPGFGSAEDIGGGVQMFDTATDFGPGPLKNTGGRSDLALRGEGFFAVQKDDEVFLTRAGNFRINENGQVVTEFGGQQYNVLNSDMSPMSVLPGSDDWEFTSGGSLTQQGQRQDLAIMMPQSLSDLIKMGSNLFQSLSDIEEVAPDQRDVAVSFLEGSSVKPTTEMVQMIEATRGIEANIKMMQTQDQMLAGLVNRLMRVA